MNSRSNHNLLIVALIAVVLIVAINHSTQPTPPRPHQPSFVTRVVRLVGLWWMFGDAAPTPPPVQSLGSSVAHVPTKRAVDANGREVLNHGAGW